jgi:DNA repair protein RAD50
MEKEGQIWTCVVRNAPPAIACRRILSFAWPLLETFCVQFGCIALNKVTVNSDHYNKKGFTVALAQILASRQAQSNSQLVLITHDGYLVVMTKNELATWTNVSMPEKYFQIRWEAPDCKFYSKIDAIDWEELS